MHAGFFKDAAVKHAHAAAAARRVVMIFAFPRGKNEPAGFASLRRKKVLKPRFLIFKSRADAQLKLFKPALCADFTALEQI